LVLFTDGRANVSAEGGDPWDEALGAGSRLRTACAGAVVIDCESGPIVLGRARMLAQALGAEYVALDDLDDTSLTIRIQGRLKSL
jgi:magnesium chelatase subunit D